MESAPTSTATPSSGPAGGAEVSSAPSGSTDQVLHRVTIDGKEKQVTLEEMRKRYEHAEASNARMREAAEIRKKYEGIDPERYRQLEQQNMQMARMLHDLKSDPKQFLALADRLNVDVSPVMEERMLEKLRYELMDENERRQFDRDKQLEEYKRKDAERAKREREQQLENMRNQAVSVVDNLFVEVLDARKDLDVNPHLTGRALDHIIFAMEHGQKLDAKLVNSALDKASHWYSQETERILKTQLERFKQTGEFPDDLVESVRKADLARAKKDYPKRTNAAPEAPKGNSSSRPQTIEEFMADQDRRYKR